MCRALPRTSLLVLTIAIAGRPAAAQTPPPADAQLAGLVKSWLAIGQPADWGSLDRLAGIRWAALPPTSLQNCLPDGGCYARQGAATIAGRSLAFVASGARTMVMNLYIRNTATPIGEAAVVAALGKSGFSTALARCPMRGGTGSTNWYRLSGTGTAPAFLAVQMTRGATPTEGFVLTTGNELPTLQPNQLALYSTDCGAGATQNPIATTLPHQKLAEIVVAALLPNTTTTLGWSALSGLPLEITWDGTAPQAMDRAILGDPNPMALTGSATWSGRQFSVVASGTATQVKALFLEEGGQHPRGEHMLGVVYEKGIAVRLVRCGPVYTESTNNWYNLTSGRTRPAMIRQSIRYDGTQVSDSYEIRLDGTLPTRDPRDRDPGVGGCA
ncbi:MAG: hypothetical protein SGI84_07330 [Gemmatimonadota bacterium]|nr:hypothetical protein [Gemmatimonadota bacterium]